MLRIRKHTTRNSRSVTRFPTPSPPPGPTENGRWLLELAGGDTGQLLPPVGSGKQQMPPFTQSWSSAYEPLFEQYDASKHGGFGRGSPGKMARAWQGKEEGGLLAWLNEDGGHSEVFCICAHPEADLSKHGFQFAMLQSKGEHSRTKYNSAGANVKKTHKVGDDLLRQFRYAQLEVVWDPALGKDLPRLRGHLVMTATPIPRDIHVISRTHEKLFMIYFVRGEGEFQGKVRPRFLPPPLCIYLRLSVACAALMRLAAQLPCSHCTHLA